MNVLVLSSEFPPKVGGIGTFAYNLSIGLAKAGKKVKVLTFGSGYSKNVEENLEIFQIHAFWNKKIVKIFPLTLWAIWICFKSKPGKILAMVWTHEGIVGFLIKKILNVKYILMTHGSEILRHRDDLNKQVIMKKVFEEAESICANSNFTKELVASLGFKDLSISVINPPISLRKIKTDDKIDQKFDLQGKRVLLTVSRLVPRKGHALVIEALAQLLPSYPDLFYVMTGKGAYGKELEGIAREKGILDHVKITGFLTDQEVSQLYRRCEIYVSPSVEVNKDIEGFGISLAEASAHGKPVIAGQCGGVTDAVLDEQTGLLIKKPTVEKLVVCISRLLEDESLRDRLGSSGKKFVEDELNIFEQAQKFQKILNFN